MCLIISYCLLVTVAEEFHVSCNAMVLMIVQMHLMSVTANILQLPLLRKLQAYKIMSLLFYLQLGLSCQLYVSSLLWTNLKAKEPQVPGAEGALADLGGHI